MLRVNSLIGGGARRPVASSEHAIAYLDNSYSGTPGTTNKSTTVSFGTAVANSKIVVGLSGQRWAGAGSLSSVTIDGQTGTIIAKVDGSNSIVALVYFDDVSGVVGGNSAVVANATTAYTWVAAAWRLTGSATGTPVAAKRDTDSGNDPANTNVDIAANGIVVSILGDGLGASSTTWTNTDQDFSVSGGDQVYAAGASRKYLTSETSQLIRANPNTANSPLFVTASFDPA